MVELVLQVVQVAAAAELLVLVVQFNLVELVLEQQEEQVIQHLLLQVGEMLAEQEVILEVVIIMDLVVGVEVLPVLVEMPLVQLGEVGVMDLHSLFQDLHQLMLEEVVVDHLMELVDLVVQEEVV
jgi:hypothetical protein